MAHIIQLTKLFAYQDLQNGLDLGLVSPEVLQNFFDLEQYPIISELTNRFQVHRYSFLSVFNSIL